MKTTTRETTQRHTPGPWHISPAGGIAGDGEVIILNGTIKDPKYPKGQKAINDGFGRAKANATLIASAPELLEALEWAESLLKDKLAQNNIISQAIAKALSRPANSRA